MIARSTLAIFTGTALLTLGALAISQETPQQAPLRVYSIQLNSAQIQLVWDAIQDRPYRQVNGLLVEIQRQVVEQNTKIEQASQAQPAQQSSPATRGPASPSLPGGRP